MVSGLMATDPRISTTSLDAYRQGFMCGSDSHWFEEEFRLCPRCQPVNPNDSISHLVKAKVMDERAREDLEKAVLLAHRDLTYSAIAAILGYSVSWTFKLAMRAKKREAQNA